jgi:hypothetical protein
LAIMKQIRGSKIIWQNKPMSTALGYFTTRLKSSIVNDKPRPSMMMPSAKGMMTVVR